jgi:hypothetical protein
MTFFKFEQDFVASLRCIPMQVRYKLDTCGIKLKLHQWNHLTQADREALLNEPCDPNSLATYRAMLEKMILDRTGETASTLAIEDAPAWHSVDGIPESVQRKSQEVGVSLQRQQWAGLNPLERFALIKLSRSGHENNNFLPALQEFDLA